MVNEVVAIISFPLHLTLHSYTTQITQSLCLRKGIFHTHVGLENDTEYPQDRP
jgi:hypothetical protein